MDLDTLLRDTAYVPDPTPHDLAAGRSALDVATMTSTRWVAVARHARRRRTRLLGITAIVAMCGEPDAGLRTDGQPERPPGSQRERRGGAHEGRRSGRSTARRVA